MRMLPVAAPHLLSMLLARCRQHRPVELPVKLLDACLQCSSRMGVKCQCRMEKSRAMLGSNLVCF
jgi:hypothetical protein